MGVGARERQWEQEAAGAGREQEWEAAVVGGSSSGRLQEQKAAGAGCSRSGRQREGETVGDLGASGVANRNSYLTSRTARRWLGMGC